MTPIKLIIVAGIGGARADFVAGWLGLLPMFVNSRWTLEPETGVSYGFQGNCRAIDQQQSISQVLLSQGCILDQNAKFTWAVACHGYDLKPKDYLPHITQETIKFVSIDVQDVDPIIIHWEFLVKTYLSHRRTMDCVKGYAEEWIIDNMINLPTITDQDRVDQMHKLLNQKHYFNRTRSLPSTMPSVMINYTQLFCTGGSRYLCQALGIDVSDSYHQYWDKIVSCADSPKQIRVWDTDWSIQQIHM